jgi:hypothetical protein
VAQFSSSGYIVEQVSSTDAKKSANFPLPISIHGRSLPSGLYAGLQELGKRCDEGRHVVLALPEGGKLIGLGVVQATPFAKKGLARRVALKPMQMVARVNTIERLFP